MKKVGDVREILVWAEPVSGGGQGAGVADAGDSGGSETDADVAGVI